MTNTTYNEIHTHGAPQEIRISTYNVGRNYNPQGIQNILQTLQIDYLATQEPPTTQEQGNRNSQQNRGTNPKTTIKDSKYNKIYLSTTLTTRLEHTAIVADGRCHFSTFNFTTQHITLCAIYDVQHNRHQ